MLGPRVPHSRRIEKLKESNLLKTFHTPRIWHAGSQHRYPIHNMRNYLSIITNCGVKHRQRADSAQTTRQECAAYARKPLFSTAPNGRNRQLWPIITFSPYELMTSSLAFWILSCFWDPASHTWGGWKVFKRLDYFKVFIRLKYDTQKSVSYINHMRRVRGLLSI